MNGWHLINSLPKLLLEVETFMENSYYTSKIDRWQQFSNLLRLSKFSSGLHLQTTVKFSHFNKFQHCCDLCVLVCTLKSPIKMMNSTVVSVYGGLSVNPLSRRCGSRYFSMKEVSWQKENQSLAVLYKKGVLKTWYMKNILVKLNNSKSTLITN